MWTVVLHPEFAVELARLSVAVRQELLAQAGVLEQFGPLAKRPRVDTLKGSKHANMKELRFDADGGVWRLALAFDTKRQAILLVAGDKGGMSQAKFYRQLIAVADRRLSAHLAELKIEDKRQKEARRKKK